MRIFEEGAKMSSSLHKLFFVVILVLVALSSTVFFVDQRERALLLHLGEI